jgi:uncharacterized membrane protein YfcA
MHNQQWPKEVIHSSLAAFFLFSGASILITFTASGLMSTQIAIFSASLAPAMLIGTGLGMVAFRRINQRLFQVISLVIIIGAGILGIISGTGIFP